MRRRNKKVQCLTCGFVLRHRAHGRCDACYCWHVRHGWDKERPKPPTQCCECGVSFRVSRHRALGRCEACYRRQWRATRMA
jgi:hypothetical protein